MAIVFESKMSYYLLNKSLGSQTEIKRNKRIQPLGESSFFIGRKIMKDIEAKLDQMATYLAEIMLSQLGFSFIPSVRPQAAKLRIGGIFTVAIGFPVEEIQPEISFNHFESLSLVYTGDYYEYECAN